LQPNLRLFAPHHNVYCPPAEESAVRCSDKDTITVLLLSESDGRDTLVDLTKTLAEMSQNGKLSPADITAELIDAEISEITSQPSQSLTPPTPHHGVGNSVSSRASSDIGPGSLPRRMLHPIMPEPDLLLVFGPYVKLDGYPPWQIRLSEIFCTGDRTGSLTGGVDEGLGVEYQGFLRGLRRYAGAQFRFGS
jgi:dehydrodolichyl diphosphate syntase complex subunit NUS1